MQLRLKSSLLITTIFVGVVFLFGIGSYAASATYTYDELNRLIRVEYADGSRIDYAYDEVGNRSQIISTFPCSVAAAKIGSIFYSSLQAAYNAAGNGETIKCRNLRFTENLTINRNITVTLDGGYNCDFTINAGGQTPVKGMLTTTVGGRTIMIKKFKFEK